MASLTAFWIAAGLIFVAELGDKSQLLSLWFATRYRVWVVLAGVATATVLLQGIAVVVGTLFGSVLPERAFLTIAAIAFFVFAAWSFQREDDEDEEPRTVAALGAYGIVTVAFVISEMGDKTQLATITLAGSRDAIGTWLGASLGMFAANAMAVGIGRWAGRRLPQRAIAIGAGVLFALFGAITLWEAWA